MVRSKKRSLTTQNSRGNQENKDQESKKKRKSTIGGLEEQFEICKIISQHGFIFAPDENEPNQLGIDQAIFIKKITNIFHKYTKQEIKSFTESLENFWQNSHRFCFSLLPTKTNEECQFSSRGKEQESLTRLLLSVNEIQTPIANLLLEKIPELDFNQDLVNTATKLGDIDLTQMIIGQLKFLDNIVDRKELTSKIMEIISVSNVDAQKDLISCLPELVDDECDEILLNKLQEMLKTSQLVTSVLDALSNMNVKNDSLSEIRTSVIDVLESADISDLPIVIKFLQNTSNEENIVDTLLEAREKLNITNFAIPNQSSTPFQRNNANSRKHLDDELLIFDSIRSGIRFQKMIADAWVKVLDSIMKSKNHKVLDLYVLVVLYSFKHKRKQLNTMFRNKIKTGVFNEEIVSKALHSHSQVFSQYLKELLMVSELLLRATDATVSAYGCNLYKQMFMSFEAFPQQEVVAALVTHIGSGYGLEIDAAFSVAMVLAEEVTSKMAPFTIFFKGLLDYLVNLNISQIRTLFNIISKLVVQGTNGNNNNMPGQFINDDLYMVIRKQLSSKDFKFKRIGVIGGMALLKNITRKNSNSVFLGDNGTDLPDDVVDQVIDLLKVMMESVVSNVQATALFYDELALMLLQMEHTNDKLLEWITDKVVSDFQQDFLTDADDFKSRIGDGQCGLQYDLDAPEEGGICVNIFPVLTKETDPNLPSSSTITGRQSKLLILPAIFRLVATCEVKQNEGSLEGIDALLGCPLVLAEDRIFNKWQTFSDHELTTHALALFHAINWMREVINAFTGENVDAEIRGKIISRIKTLILLSNRLETLMAASHNFQLPITDFSVDEAMLKTVKTSSSGGETKKKTSKSKQKDTTSNNTTSANATIGAATTTNNDGEQPSSDKEDDDGSKNNEDINATIESSYASILRYPASFRPLSLTVFYALSYEGVSKAIMDTEQHTKTREDLNLSANDINFMLVDLQRKLEYSLGNSKRSFLKQSASKVIGFSNLPSDMKVIKFMKKIIPSLICHFKFVKNFFTDEDASMTNESLEETDHYINLYNNLVQCLTLLFNWSKFTSQHTKELESIVDIFVKTLDDVTITKKKMNFHEKLVLIIKSFQPELSELQHISMAVKICKFISSMSQYLEKEDGNENGGNVDDESSNETCKKMKRDLLLKLLRHRWKDAKGSVFNDHYSYLIRNYLKTCSDSLGFIEKFCACPIQQTLSNEAVEEYPTLTKVTAICFYRSFYEELNGFVKTRLVSTTRTIVNNEEITNQYLSRTHSALKIFQTMNSLLKEFEGRLFMMVALKYSKYFLEVFLKNVMPILDRTLRSHKQIVHGILKTAQQSTRSLQHLCNHSKVSKDIAMTTHVPALKKCLEAFVFRVKAVLAYNNCDGVFWLGNLKNRDLQGNEIQSQVDPTSQDSEDENETHDAEEGESLNDDEENDECSESF
eukprot:TCONS_00019611-protein